MTTNQCFQLYLALKAHFNSDYDFFKYNGKVNLTAKTLQNRNDKYYFEKLSKLKNPLNYLLANFVKSEGVWVGELFNEQCTTIANKHQSFLESLSYHIQEELKKLHDNFDENFIIMKNEHPLLLKKYLSEEISIELLIILDEIIKYSKYWNQKLENDFLWTPIFFKMQKYKPFFKYDKLKLKEIIKKRWVNIS